MKKRVPELTHSQYAIHAVDALFNDPLFRASNFAQRADIPTETAKRILKILLNDGVLRTVVQRKGRSGRILMFSELIKIAAT